MDGQAREGNGRAERERTSQILMRTEHPSNLTYYYHDNHEGSVTHLMLANGTVIESYRYDAFGAPAITTAQGYSPNNRFMFTGREYIKEFGIYEYRARAYHPGIGRFMSEDPKGFDAGDYNLFRYCKNDPLDLTDPMGLATAPDTSPTGSVVNRPRPYIGVSATEGEISRINTYMSNYYAAASALNAAYAQITGSGGGQGQFQINVRAEARADGSTKGSSASILNAVYKDTSGDYTSYKLKSEMSDSLVNNGAFGPDKRTPGRPPMHVESQPDGLTIKDNPGLKNADPRPRPGAAVRLPPGYLMPNSFEPRTIAQRLTAIGIRSNGVEVSLGSRTWSAFYQPNAEPSYSGVSKRGQWLPADPP